MKYRLAAAILIFFATPFLLADDALAQGNAERGGRLFRQRCAGCHINQSAGGRGPNLTDIVGGVPTVPGFNYSSSIRVMSWAWTPEQLERYLRHPARVVPGATMASRVRNKKNRTDIIAYLRTLRSPEGTPPARGRSRTGLEAAPSR